jgi:hypothetical protein
MARTEQAAVDGDKSALAHQPVSTAVIEGARLKRRGTESIPNGGNSASAGAFHANPHGAERSPCLTYGVQST